MKKKKNKKRRRLNILLGILLVVILGIGSYPYLRIKEVQIQGNSLVSKEKVEQILNPYKGRNLIFVVRIPLRLKQNFKQIESVKISFLKSPFKIGVKIVEKTPYVAFIRTKNNIVIAKDGTVLQVDADPQSQSWVMMPMIKGMESLPIQNGKVIPRIVSEVVPLVEAIQQKVSMNEGRLEVNEYGAWTLYIQDVLPVKIGSADDVSEKMLRLEKFLAYYREVSTENLKQVDLRIPKRVIVSYHGPE